MFVLGPALAIASLYTGVSFHVLTYMDACVEVHVLRYTCSVHVFLPIYVRVYVCMYVK